MNDLVFHKKPSRRFRTLVAAFGGWPDAAESATRAIEYLVSKLPARRMAEIDPEQFYDFSTIRPITRVDNNGERTIRWPDNVFYYSVSDNEEPGVILLIGVEPSLKWRAYTELVMSVVEQFGVEQVVSLGALLDSVPHTRPVKLTGVASTQEARDELAKTGMLDSGYQGPSAIHTVLMDACKSKNIRHVSLWGHCPHYVNTSPNPVVSHALLSKLSDMTGVQSDLSELRESVEEFQEQVSQAVQATPDIDEYVRQLEDQYDDSTPDLSDIPDPEQLVEDLETFLKSRRSQQGDDKKNKQ